MAENDNERMVSELEPDGGSGYVLGEGPDAVVISASEARRLRRSECGHFIHSVSTLSHSLTLTLTVSQSPINRIFEFLTFDFSNFQKFNVYVWNKYSGVSISTKRRLESPKFLTHLY